MEANEFKELVERLNEIKKELGEIKLLLKDRTQLQINIPLPITRVAGILEMNRETLLDMIQRKEIKAYRPGPKQPWRVIPSDVLVYLTKENNQNIPRRQSVLNILNKCKKS